MTGGEPERTCVVAARELVAPDIVRIDLRPVDDEPLPPWEPGAHIDVVLADGELVRQYSLCGDPADHSCWHIAVLRTPDSRGGSRAVHDDLEVGSVVQTRGPRNAFGLEPADRYHFIAGGIGITPILPMIEALAVRGVEWSLVYGGRSRSAMAFLDRLAVHGERVEVVAEDEHGMMDLDRSLLVDDGTLVYCCGPAGMLDAVSARAEVADRVRMERFAAPAAEVDGDDRPFDVVLERSGMELHIEPGQSILTACQAVGVDVPCSCTEGICGTCETDVLEGVPDHRDHVLSPEERESGETMMVCVSRARTDRLVLDL